MDEANWDDLLSEQIRQHGRLFFRLANGVLRNPEAAEDACQEAFLQAWKARDQIHSPKALRGWIARAVVNNSLQVIRRAKAERSAMQQRAQIESNVEPHPGDRIDTREAILLAMERLPEMPRLVVAMRIWESASGNEVAETLECSAAEVSRNLHRGLAQLRSLLAPSMVGAIL